MSSTIYFKLVPYGETASGEAWEIGPHVIADSLPEEINLEVNELLVTKGSQDAHVDLISGIISTSNEIAVDSILVNTYYNMDYIIKIKGASGSVQGTRLSLVITGNGGTGVSLEEYGGSSDSPIVYGVIADANNVYLTVSGTVDTPASFKAYKTSV